MHEFSRRDFLKAGAIGAGALALTALGGEKVAGAVGKFEHYFESLDYLDGVRPSPNPLPKPLRGLTLNSPFLWNYDNDYVDWVAGQAKAMGARTIRIFVNDDFEPELENYNDSVLENIKRVSGRIGNTKLIISLFDAYTLLHSDKQTRDIESKPLSSPYFLQGRGESKEQKQLGFFKSEGVKSCFHERLDYIVRSLKDVETITAWEVANEVELPDEQILTRWFNENIGVIRSRDMARPIITGLAKPWLISEEKFLGKNVVNSFHVYPLQTEIIDGITAFAPESRLPLTGLELGVSQDTKMFIKYPIFVYQIIKSVISDNTLYAEGLGLWKIGQNADGYDLGNSEYSRYFKRLSRKLRSIQTE